jgi:hypothetical protein
VKLEKLAGITSEIWQVFIRDSSSTTGAGLTGLAFGSSGLTAYYNRDTDSSPTVINLVTMTAGTFTSSGFKEVSSANMPGVYQFCPPNAALAAGAKSCFFLLKGATNMAPLPIEVQLVAYNPDDTVRLGLTALPNVASGSAGAIPTTGTGANQISVSSGQVILQTGTGTGQLDFTSGVVKANATQWLGGTIPAVNVTGVPKVDVVDWLGTAPSTPTVAGVPNVNVKTWNDLATVALPLVPTVAGRTLDVSTGGEAGLDWANIGTPTTSVNLSGTSIQTVNSLATGTDSINTIATSGSTLTTGTTITGSYASTTQLDGTYWQIADSAGTLDMYFEFNVGSVGVPTSIEWVGGLTTAVNSLKVYGYNWGSASWEQVGTINGTSTLISNTQVFDMTTSHVGTGGNLGLVRLRFANTSLTAANFYTDRILCGYTSVYTFPTNFASLSINGSGQIDAIKLAGQTITAAAGVTFPASVASPTNITAGTITTVTNLTNAPTSGDLTATMKASVATATWTDTTAGDFTVSASIGKSVMNGVALGTGLTVNDITTKTGYALTAAYDPAKTAAQAGDAMTLTSGERNSVADALLNRDMSVGTDSGSSTFRTPRQALRFLRNKWAISGGTLTVYAEDDATASWTSTPTTDATALPIISNDPAGP